MKVFVRDLNTWAALATLDASSWEVPVFSSADSTGTITVAGEYSLGGSWAVIDGMVFYIEKTAASGGSTVLTVRKPFYAFKRDLVYSGTGTEELGAFIAAEITGEFINQADSAYKMAYLSVISSTDITYDLGYGENEVFSFLDVFQLAEELGIEFDFSPEYDELTVTISERSPASHNVWLEDGKTFLQSATLTSEIVAKVTVRRITVQDSLITVESSTDYYWHEDGTITTTPPFPRIKGSWAVVSITDADIDLIEGAKDAMKNNASAYKITFYSDMSLHLGDVCTFRLNGEVVTGTVTLKKVSSSARDYYECGDLPTTMTEKFSKATEKTKKPSSVTYENGDSGYLSASGGTVGGAMTVAGQLNANGAVVVDANSYGPALPATGKEGQIFFVVS